MNTSSFFNLFFNINKHKKHRVWKIKKRFILVTGQWYEKKMISSQNTSTFGLWMEYWNGKGIKSLQLFALITVFLWKCFLNSHNCFNYFFKYEYMIIKNSTIPFKFFCCFLWKKHIFLLIEFSVPNKLIKKNKNNNNNILKPQKYKNYLTTAPSRKQFSLLNCK